MLQRKESSSCIGLLLDSAILIALLLFGFAIGLFLQTVTVSNPATPIAIGGVVLVLCAVRITCDSKE